MRLIESKIADVFLLLQFVQYLLFILTGNLLAYYGNSVVGVLSLFYLFMNTGKLNKLCLTSLMVASAILFLVNQLFANNFPVTDIIREYLSFFSTAALLIFTKYNEKLFRYFFWIVCGVIAFRMFQSQGDEYSIFYLGSRNYISMYLVFFLFPYCYGCNRDGKPVGVFPAISILIMSLIAQGRGGILMSAVLLVLMLLKNMFFQGGSSKRSWWIVITSVIALIIGVYIVFYTNYLDEFLVRFDQDVEDESRIFIWSEYFKVLNKDFLYIVLGAPLSSVSILSYFQHLHNSYLMVHACVGLLGLILLFVYSFKGIRKLWKYQYHDVAILFISVYIKSFTDYCFPKQITDVFIWFIIIFASLKVLKK